MLRGYGGQDWTRQASLACVGFALMLVYQCLAVAPEDTVIVPGISPIDTDGIEVQAHGGGILKIKDTFYWFGESYKRPLDGDFLSEGVNLYSSTDFASWTYEGLVFNATAQLKGVPGGAPYRLERPKILYNQLYDRYVLLFHADTVSFAYPTVGVAIAQDIRGPYELVRVFHPDGLNSYDMGVFQEDDGTAYLVRSVENKYVGISQLTPDYTNTMGITSTAPQGEGPAIIKPANGSYYLMTSHLSGWAPNAPQLFHADAANLGDASWHKLAQPSIGEDANITYNSQPTFIFPFEFEDGTVLYIYMGDRWNFYTKRSVESATYVWLPLLPRSDGLGYELHYLSKWSPADFKQLAQQPLLVPNDTASAETVSAAEGSAPSGAAAAEGNAPSGAAAEQTPANPPPGVLDFDKRHPIPTLAAAGLARTDAPAVNASWAAVNATAAAAAVQAFQQQLGSGIQAVLG